MINFAATAGLYSVWLFFYALLKKKLCLNFDNSLLIYVKILINLLSAENVTNLC